MNDEFFMGLAIGFAKVAVVREQRPFGGVIVDPTGELLGAGGGSELPTDPTRHHEMEAIRSACQNRGDLLQGCTLYSTHEPCLMCTGAILHSKLSRVVWGSFRSDLPSLFRPLNIGFARFGDTTHPPDIKGGILRRECIELFDEEVLTKAMKAVQPR
jgi:tRNA(adenine34) deaminase